MDGKENPEEEKGLYQDNAPSEGRNKDLSLRSPHLPRLDLFSRLNES